jgi:hypothetical protein
VVEQDGGGYGREIGDAGVVVVYRSHRLTLSKIVHIASTPSFKETSRTTTR